MIFVYTVWKVKVRCVWDLNNVDTSGVVSFRRHLKNSALDLKKLYLMLF